MNSNSCLPYFVSLFQVQFLPLPHLLIFTVSDSVLPFHSRFHFPIVRFQLLFWLLTVGSLSSFLSSSPHIYIYTDISRVIQLRYPYIPISFVLYSFMPSDSVDGFFFFLSMFVSAFFVLWCRWLLRYIYFLNHFCQGVEFVTAGLFNWSTASFGYVHSEFFWGFSRLGKPKNWVRSLCTQRFSLVVYLVAKPMCSMISIFDVFVLDQDEKSTNKDSLFCNFFPFTRFFFFKFFYFYFYGGMLEINNGNQQAMIVLYA